MSEQTLTYEEAWQQIHDRFLAAGNQVATAITGAGGTATVSEPNTADLRISVALANRNRNALVYFEFTDSLHIGYIDTTQARGVITLYVDGGGQPIATNYVVGPLQVMTDEAGLNALLAKVGEVEAQLPDVITKLRAYLRL